MNSLIQKCVICILLCLSFGIGSGLTTSVSDMSWYDNLIKPFFNPPSWIFGPAWTILYTLMGISIALIWHEDSEPQLRSRAQKIFLVQFVLNLLWTPIFFSMQNMCLALVIIVILWFSILVTIKKFGSINKTAAYLLVPYLLWVSFATILNASLLYLN